MWNSEVNITYDGSLFFYLNLQIQFLVFLSKRSKMSCRSRNKQIVIHVHKLIYANSPQKFSEPTALTERNFLTYLKLEPLKTTGETIFLTIKLQKEKLTLQQTCQLYFITGDLFSIWWESKHQGHCPTWHFCQRFQKK